MSGIWEPNCFTTHVIRVEVICVGYGGVMISVEEWWIRARFINGT